MRREGKKAEVSRFRKAEPPICLFNWKERRDRDMDGREEWPYLLFIRIIMRHNEGRDRRRLGGKAQKRKEGGHQTEVKEKEGCKG